MSASRRSRAIALPPCGSSTSHRSREWCAMPSATSWWNLNAVERGTIRTSRRRTMSTISPDAALPDRPMLHALAKSWWLVLLRGMAGILFGVLAFAWPGLTLVTLVLFYGAYALVDGVIALVAAFTGGAKPVPTWWLVVVGLLGIGAGIATFVMPGITAILLILFMGAWAL